MRDRWDAETLQAVRALATDLSSLLTSLEVARRREGADRSVERSYAVAARMRVTLERLIDLLSD